MGVEQKEKVKKRIFYDGSKGPKFGVRYLQVTLMAINYAHLYTSKTIFSVALVAMTTKTSSNPQIPTYSWDNLNVLISAVLWSGIPFTIYAGHLGKIYGPKWFIVSASAINSFAFAAIPLTAHYMGSSGVMLCRIIQGMCLGVLHPQNGVVYGRWVPPMERSRMGYIGTGMLSITGALMSFTSGYVASSKLGWPGIFYGFGGIGMVLSCLEMLFGYQNADRHPHITPEEKLYLHSTLFTPSTKKEPTPWKEIFTSKYLWAVAAGQTSHNWSLILLRLEMPLFLTHALKYDVTSNGTISALPTLIGVPMGVVVSTLSDYITNSGLLSVVNSRRAFHMIGTFCTCLCLIFMTYISIEHRTWIVVLICLANLGSLVTSLGGASLNIIDISPKYAGIIFGVDQTCGTAVSLFAPLAVQWICKDMGDLYEWRKIYWISTVIAVSLGMFFVFFSTDKRQQWGEAVDDEEIPKRKISILSLNPEAGF